MDRDVPSPIDLRQRDDARRWAAEAEARPGRAEIMDRIVEEAARVAGAETRVLELGSGPGFLAERLLRRLPEVRYTALDFSPAMHALARDRLARFVERVTFLQRSFRSADWIDGLEAFDLVVTNQAVHELRHKRHAETLHRQVLGLSSQAGSYLVSDHFYGPGGLTNQELYMTQDEQQQALESAGFDPVERLLVRGSLVLHAARKT